MHVSDGVAGAWIPEGLKVRWRRLCLGAGLVLLQAVAVAQGLAASAADDVPERAAVERFTVTVQAPDTLPEFLRQHLDLMRYRSLADLDTLELRRLVAQVPADAAALLATQGYMSPQVSAWLEGPPRQRAAGPAAADAGTVKVGADAGFHGDGDAAPLPPAASTATSTATPSLPASGAAPAAEATAVPRLGQVVVQIDPGPLTRVTQVDVQLEGDIARRPEAQAQREEILAAFSLKPGQVFTQARWDEAKQQALRALTAQRYPGGRVLHSAADIDPDTQAAVLHLVLDSGAALRLGEIQIQGMARYDPDMVRRLLHLAGMTPGSSYALSRVLDAQRRVAESGYFESVFITVEPGDEPDRAPVVVKLREVPLQKLVTGVGGSTDSGARLSLEHTHHRLPGLGWRAQSALTLARNHQSAQTTLTSAVNDAGWRWLVSGQLTRQEDASGRTTSQRLRAGQTQDTTEFSRSLFLQYDRARTYTPGQPADGQASVSANFGWTLRRLDHLMFPERGYTLSAELGSGLTLEQSRRPYVRTRLRGLVYLPFDEAAQGRLALRADAGAVWARGTVPVPSTELFLTGGDTTVRGYALRSLGVVQADGSVDPGQVMATGSVEWQRPLAGAAAWENTFFIDTGAVADRAAQLRPKLGLGTGVRYRSPVGPLQLDLAYGVATRRLRLHLTLGFKF